jgi:predicted dehydrogenase
MLDRESPDVVDICTPPRTHAGIAIEAMKAGCQVMIEKPMATSVEDCDEIMRVAGASGVKVGVAHSDLFYPPFVRARELVTSGEIGEFKGMRVFLSTPTGYMTAREDHWAHKLPGGVIGESGPHAVYMTLAFINPVREVHARGHKLLDQYPWSRFEDYRIELAGEDAVSSITSVYTSDEWAGEVELWGTKGLLKLDLEVMSLVRQRRKDLGRLSVARSGVAGALGIVSGIVRTGASVAARRYRNTHELLLEGFLTAVSTGSEPPVSGAEGREAVRVMDLIAAGLDS